MLIVLYIGNTSYVLEYCGTVDGHVWKELAPAKELLDGVRPPQAFRNNTIGRVAPVLDRTLVTFTIKFYYTPEFAASTPDIDGYLDQVISETNQGFANSGIEVRVRLEIVFICYICFTN